MSRLQETRFTDIEPGSIRHTKYIQAARKPLTTHIFRDEYGSERKVSYLPKSEEDNAHWVEEPLVSDGSEFRVEDAE